jgi:hypothetical protein
VNNAWWVRRDQFLRFCCGAYFNTCLVFFDMWLVDWMEYLVWIGRCFAVGWLGKWDGDWEIRGMDGMHCTRLDTMGMHGKKELIDGSQSCHSDM